MKFNHPLSWRSVVVACWAMLPLSAADGEPTFDFKLRGGLTAGDLSKDHADTKAFGFGVAGRFPLGSTRALSVELGFDYFPGQDRDLMPGNGPVYYNYQAPVTTYGGQNLYLSTGNSIDFRKEYAQGFSLRCAYSDAIPTWNDWYWFAGVSLDFYRTTAELSGTLIPMSGGAPVPGYEPVDPANPEGPVKDYYEGWAMAPSKTKLGVGLLAGLGLPFSENYKFEFTVRNIGTTHFDYRPFTYTGQAAVLEEKTHRGFVFELSIAMKL